MCHHLRFKNRGGDEKQTKLGISRKATKNKTINGLQNTAYKFKDGTKLTLTKTEVDISCSKRVSTNSVIQSKNDVNSLLYVTSDTCI